MSKPKKKLISLESHEMAARAAWRPAVPRGANGIACPQCGAELEDVGFVEQIGTKCTCGTKCLGCDYQGRRTMLPDECPKV
jgi:hypothetical protein